MTSTSVRTSLLGLAFVALSVAAAIGCGPMTPTGVAPGTSGTPPNGRHHPSNFADPTQHGPNAKFRTEDCTMCHGANLDGQGSQVDPASLALAPQGCNSHHNQFSGAAPDAWRTDCTFCHGDRSGSYDAAKTGAPPRDLKDVGCTPSGAGCTPVAPDATMVAGLAFKKHLIHITASATHPAYDCVTCHPSKPTDAMSPGHWIVGDDTPGVVEISAVLGGPAGSPTLGGTYAGPGTGTCNNTYCHGNGITPKTVSDTQTSTGCNFCHSNLAGRHGDHNGASCYDCHGATVNASNQISDVSKHINGVGDFLLTVSGATLTYSGGTNGHCSGDCHMGNETRTHNDNW